MSLRDIEVGFDTIGNAILICYDRTPVLVTDPWIAGSAYFGSWGFSHLIPQEQMNAIRSCPIVWISHGHPDHLSSTSLKQLKDKKILLPDHVGNRIVNELSTQGYKIQTLKDRIWYKISDRVRILCLSDYNQDAILLVDINGRLIFNKNDAVDHGWEAFVRKIVKRYKVSFLMALSSRFGDADMINFFNEDSRQVPLRENVPKLGARNAHKAEVAGTRYFIPFSSMHIYQREDSVWANQYHTSLSDYADGFKSDKCEILPAYIQYDCLHDTFQEINPPETSLEIFPPEKFGDNWSDTLGQEDIELAAQYFKSFEHLQSFLDFINLRVGGRDNVIEIRSKKFNRGITFEAPRNSLMKAIKYKIFDDMLIANFMKTTLHGEWRVGRLYPDFTPYVAKYGDNGQAKSKKGLETYMKAYRDRAFLDFLKHEFERKAEAIYRSYVSEDSLPHRAVKRIYWFYKKSLR